MSDAPDLDAAMRRAVELSRAVLGTTSPNPPVGAVVLDEHGEVVGEGATQPPGGAHAEVMALRQAGHRAHTVVVTLEPCAHTGRTGPCTEQLIDGGVQRVVIGCAEPTSLAGGGADRLRAAGLEVQTGVLEAEVAAGPLAPWLHRQRTGRPYVTWKYAATLDGRSAAADGTSRWITGDQARADVHRLRSECDAIVVGVGTVLADDPALTARPDPGHQPLRVVLDRGNRTSPTAKVLDDAAPSLVITDSDDLEAVLKALDQHGVVSVLLEGGPTLAGAFLQADLVDRVIGYVAPALLGDGVPALVGAGVGTIEQAIRMELVDVSRIGDDLRLTLHRRR